MAMADSLEVRLVPMGGGEGGGTDAKMVSHYRGEGEGGRKKAGRWDLGRHPRQAPGCKGAVGKAI